MGRTVNPCYCLDWARRGWERSRMQLFMQSCVDTDWLALTRTHSACSHHWAQDHVFSLCSPFSTEKKDLHIFFLRINIRYHKWKWLNGEKKQTTNVFPAIPLDRTVIFLLNVWKHTPPYKDSPFNSSLKMCERAWLHRTFFGCLLPFVLLASLLSQWKKKASYTANVFWFLLMIVFLLCAGLSLSQFVISPLWACFMSLNPLYWN